LKAVLGVVVALMLLAGAGFAGWFIRGEDEDATKEIKVGVPTIVSSSELQDFAVDHYPLYWAGKVPDTKIELTLTSKNGVFVRYIPKDAKAGVEDEHLTVATYDSIGGYDGLAGASKKVADVEHGKNGAVITVFKEQPLSTYFSFENATFQVEVFSPNKGEAKKMTDAGDIALVEGAERDQR
jgi:hypothetical protein